MKLLSMMLLVNKKAIYGIDVDPSFKISQVISSLRIPWSLSGCNGPMWQWRPSAFNQVSGLLRSSRCNKITWFLHKQLLLFFSLLHLFSTSRKLNELVQDKLFEYHNSPLVLKNLHYSCMVWQVQNLPKSHPLQFHHPTHSFLWHQIWL